MSDQLSESLVTCHRLVPFGLSPNHRVSHRPLCSIGWCPVAVISDSVAVVSFHRRILGKHRDCFRLHYLRTIAIVSFHGSIVEKASSFCDRVAIAITVLQRSDRLRLSPLVPFGCHHNRRCHHSTIDFRRILKFVRVISNAISVCIVPFGGIVRE